MNCRRLGFNLRFAASSSFLPNSYSRDKPQRCYAIAGLANACAHPVLAGRIKDLKGIQILQKIEKENNKGGIVFGGTRIGECAETALIRLGVGGDGGGGVGGGGGNDIGSSGDGSGKPGLHRSNSSGYSINRKYSFKWGEKPMMELTLDSKRHRGALIICIILWIVMCMAVLQPVLRPDIGLGHLV